MSAPTRSCTTLFGRELLFETADALAEAGRLWPVTAQLAQCIAAEYPPPHALRGTTVVELGAGTAALSCALANAYEGVTVLATDLPAVLPLLERNAARCRGGAGAVRAVALPWGTGLDGPDAPPHVDVVLCCECAYWGGWDVLQADTRAPLRATLRALCSPCTRLFFAFTLRDAERELGLLHALCTEDGFQYRCMPGSASPADAREGDVLLLVLTRGHAAP